MIHQTFEIIYGREFRHTASDRYLIQKLGTQEVYDDACDLMPCEFEYVETDIEKPIDDHH